MYCKSATTVTPKNTVNFRNPFLFWRILANIESQCSMNALIANLLSRLHLNSWHSDKQWSSQKVNCFFSLGSEKTTAASEFCPHLHAGKHYRNVILDMTFNCKGQLMKNLILRCIQKSNWLLLLQLHPWQTASGKICIYADKLHLK